MYLDPFPFGNTDGTSQPLDAQVVNPLSTQEMLPSQQQSSLVIVGAKGTGKSYSLKRLRFSLTNASNHQDYYVDEIQRDVPPTDDVQDFTFSFAERVATEKWSKAWQCAIVNAFTSHILFAPEIKHRIEDPVSSRLREHADHFYPFRETPISVYAQLAHISHEKDDAQLDQYLEDSQWQDYMHTIDEISQDVLPTLYFFMDSIDEHYHRSPYAWMKCQKGLFYCIRRIAANPRFLGGKLKIIVALRDHVIFDIFRTDTGSALLFDDLLRVLSWDQEAIVSFLSSKIGTLSEQYRFADPVRDINQWLGIDATASFEQNQSLTSYVLSNTRRVPRDIVIIGNNLAERVRQSKSLKRVALRPDDVVNAVMETSASLGHEQILLAQDYVNTFNKNATDNMDMFRSLSQSSRLHDFLSMHAQVRMTRRSLHDLNVKSHEVFGQGINLPLILYQNRILGFMRNGQAIYYSGNLPPDNFANDSDYFVFHPTVTRYLGLSVARRSSRR